MLVLAIESSCDDTAAAVVKNGTILSNLRSGQDNIHCKFGGVVPELASRQHLKAIHPLVNAALCEAGVHLEDIELIAATRGPGLIGSLLVGFSYAKALAHVRNIPLIGVDHMTGHILSAFFSVDKPVFPYIALLVSGGSSGIYLAEEFTTFRCLGRTRDDAAGEAFDKTAKLLDLPYPGGPQVAKLAEKGNPDTFHFPRSWLGNSYDFSFSGLKTAVLNQINALRQNNLELPVVDICASFQKAVVDVLTTKTLRAAQEYGVKDVTIGGGVSANSTLRQRLEQECLRNGIHFHAPPFELCTDNAAMIAFAGEKFYEKNGPCTDVLQADVFSRSILGQ